MPVYKDKKNGKWYVMVRYKDCGGWDNYLWL